MEIIKFRLLETERLFSALKNVEVFSILFFKDGKDMNPQLEDTVHAAEVGIVISAIAELEGWR